MRLIRLLIPLGLSSLLLCAAMWAATNNLVTIEFQIRQAGNNAVKIFVDSGKGFNEDEAFSFRRKSVDGWRSIKTALINKPGMIRIDTTPQPTGFELKNIRMRRIDGLIPAAKMIDLDLDPAKPDLTWHLDKPRDSNEYHSTGSDPQLVWRTPSPGVRNRTVLLANFAVLFSALSLLTLVVVGIAEARNSHLIYTTKDVCIALETLLIYPLFLAVAKLTDDFAGILHLHYYALAAALVGFGIFLCMRAVKYVNWRMPFYFVSICTILFSFVPDILFRANLLHKPVFARYEQPGYYWTAAHSRPFKHTSLGYYEDIEKIRELVTPGTFFLSDIATSYYLSAALPLYATNLHSHHQVSHDGWFSNVDSEFLRRLCKSPDQEYVRQYLRKKARIHQDHGWPDIKYLVINRHAHNRNVVGDCLAKHKSRVLDNLRPMIRELYRGALLDVYEFDGLGQHTR